MSEGGRFDACLPVILSFEGGYVNDPKDHGGATDHGITQTTYTAWLLGEDRPDQDVAHITDSEVATIYRDKYWTPCSAPFCPEPLDLVTFDCAVNSGVGRAVLTLQEALGTVADGVVGPATKALLSSCNAQIIARRFLIFREQFYRDIVARHPDQERFLDGWLSRVERLRKLVG